MEKYVQKARKLIVIMTCVGLWFILTAFCYKEGKDEQPKEITGQKKGILQIKIYYDKKRECGCGIRYVNGIGEQSEYGFAWYGADMESWQSKDPYLLQTVYGDTDFSNMQDYREDITRDEEGRITEILAQAKDVAELEAADEMFRTGIMRLNFIYDKAQRLVYEDAYMTHGGNEYYYIYEKDGKTPSYCLMLDDNLGSSWIPEFTCYDNAVQESEKFILPESFGILNTAEGENVYTQAVRQAKVYEDAEDALTYEMDYDGDGDKEAFVLIGKELILEEEENERNMDGELWFVNSKKEVTLLRTGMYQYGWEGQYVTIEGKTWILLSYIFGNPIMTDMYTVEQGDAVEVLPGGFKTLNEQGQILVEQSAYDLDCMWEEPGNFLWTGHTWKYYTFTYKDGEFQEIRAREISRQELEEMGASLENIDNSIAPNCLKQYILRENGELDVNVAKIQGEWAGFSHGVFRRNAENVWELEDEFYEGYYLLMFSEDTGQSFGTRVEKLLDFKCTLINCLKQLDIVHISVGE